MPTKHRLNLDITPKIKLQLDELCQRTDTLTYIEVVRKAIALYDLVTTEERNGARILIQTDNDTQRIKLL